MKKENNVAKKGFTLIELLVVVLIIGILAAVALPQYQKAVIKSEYAKLKTIVHTIAQAEEVYYLANGEYTRNVDLLDVDFPPYNSVQTSSMSYSYDWGTCWVSTRAWCKNKKADIAYSYYFQHQPEELAYRTGKQICTAYNDKPIQHSICRTEAGGADPEGGEYIW